MDNNFNSKPDATSKLTKDVRKSRKLEDTIDQDKLIEVDPVLFNEFKKNCSKKGNRGYFNAFDFYTNIVHRRNVPYLLKNSAKLHRSRKPIKNYNANYGQSARSKAKDPDAAEEKHREVAVNTEHQ